MVLLSAHQSVTSSYRTIDAQKGTIAEHEATLGLMKSDRAGSEDRIRALESEKRELEGAVENLKKYVF